MAPCPEVPVSRALESLVVGSRRTETVFRPLTLSQCLSAFFHVRPLTQIAAFQTPRLIRYFLFLDRVYPGPGDGKVFLSMLFSLFTERASLRPFSRARPLTILTLPSTPFRDNGNFQSDLKYLDCTQQFSQGLLLAFDGV